MSSRPCPHLPACLWLVLLLLGLLPLTTRAEDRALLIGVGNYRHGSHLPGISKDMAMMRTAAGMLGFKPWQVRVLQDRQATLKAMDEAIQTWLINGTGAADRALFYFSGHGSQITDKDGDEADGADEVLIAHDADLVQNRLVNVLVDDRFGQLLDRIPARQVLVLIDACNSGTATRGVSMVGHPAPVRDKVLAYPGMPVSQAGFAVDESGRRPRLIGLSACGDNELAVATVKGSLFTRGLLATLQHHLEGGRPLTINDIRRGAAAYIRRNLPVGRKLYHPRVTGNAQMAALNLLRAPETPWPAHKQGLWSGLEQLARQAAYRLELTVNQPRFRVGDRLQIRCRVPRDGYLNIVNLSPGEQQAVVLFPNRFHAQNRVAAGQVVLIPGQGQGFELRAQPPAGESLLMGFVTPQPINAYRDGLGPLTDVFRTLSDRSLRALRVVEKTAPDGLGAGVLRTNVY